MKMTRIKWHFVTSDLQLCVREPDIVDKRDFKNKFCKKKIRADGIMKSGCCQLDCARELGRKVHF